MKRHYTIILLLLCVSLRTYAQADLEAKAAYLLAEEKYQKGEAKAALQYLDEATTKLGSPNAKILYLKIIIQKELANNDGQYLTKLDSSINLFQSSADIKSFSEEKALEVMKIKLELKKELAKINAEKEAELAKINVAKEEEVLAAAGIKLYEKEHPDWPLGTSIDTIRAKYADLFKTSTKSKKGKFIGYVDRNSTSGIAAFSFFNDRLYHYEQCHFFYKDDDREHSKGKAALASVLDDFRKRFGYLPKPTIYDQSNYHTETYTWKSGSKSVNLTSIFLLLDVGKMGSQCLSSIIDPAIN